MAKMFFVHIFTKFSHQNLKLLLCTKLQSLRKTVILASVLKLSTGTCRLDSMDNALEKEMATHSSVLAWRIPGTGEPGGLPSMGSHRVGHD